MVAQKLDGKAASAAIKAELAERVAALAAKGVVPGIATVLVGADPASQLYVGMKHRQSEAIGMNSMQRELPADATQAEVEALKARQEADASDSHENAGATLAARRSLGAQLVFAAADGSSISSNS